VAGWAFLGPTLDNVPESGYELVLALRVPLIFKAGLLTEKGMVV